eukprot:69312-Rhodomonas_salina.8
MAGTDRACAATSVPWSRVSSLSAYALATRRPALLSAYARAMRCPVLAQRLVVLAYGYDAMPTAVLT